MSPVWEGLLANFAVPAIIMMVWSLILDRIGGFSARIRSVILGIVFGMGTIVTMAMAFEVSPGIIFDFRASQLAVAAFFGGWPAALVAAPAALFYRLEIGGGGGGAGGG